ncbi:NAD(P)-binding protein [Fistulina hepatica ATCC 64428]|uniref:NAD(P)-binding protein n=1 Tax=Fistulina hepatica ATCC 64428 TaxID=1128425 RepID=A0A0D7AL36_9AGAR|nr:NAD(P)-binding protein [Fistulina hepatica ATCC 64428]
MPTPHAPAGSIPFSPMPTRPTTPLAGMRLGFVGLGSMGYFMARNLAKAAGSVSPPLMVWNRTKAKSERLQKELGADAVVIAPDLVEVVRECDIVFTNLANDAVIKDVYQRFAAALEKSPAAKSKIFVETSTIYPKLAGEIDTLLTTHAKCHFITACVFGRPSVADAAQLVIVMAGDYHSKKVVAHQVVPAMGRKVIDVGGNVVKAPTLKLVGNSMILGVIEIMAESFTLAEKSGLDTDTVLGVVNELFPNTPYVHAAAGYAERMCHDKFDGSQGFSIEGGIKDATLIRKLTTEHNSPMPALDIAHQHLITARALHRVATLEGQQSVEVLDWSSIIAGSRVAAGLDGFDSAKVRWEQSWPVFAR